MRKSPAPANSCPCGHARSYAACCAPYHGELAAETAEALMRSRYSAYVLELEPYLLATWHPDTRPEKLGLAEERPAHWLGLTIVRVENTCENSATIEFVARYKVGGRAHRLHEISRFVREDGRWFYLEGHFPTQNTPDMSASK